MRSTRSSAGPANPGIHNSGIVEGYRPGIGYSAAATDTAGAARCGLEGAK
jgi:hypothetical protein